MTDHIDPFVTAAVAAILGLPAAAHAIFSEMGATTPEWVGGLTQVSAFGLVAWIVFYMFSKWLPAIQSEHASQLEAQRNSHTEAMRTIAEAHAAAVQKMAESFTDNLKAQRADLLALRVCRAVDSKSTP